VIAFLRGLVCSRSDDHVVVDVNGVGYRVFMAPPNVRALAHGEEVSLHIHTHVREDAFQLFGFVDETQRTVFLALKSVKGIGPKLAMAVIGNTTTAELLEAVVGGDVKRLTSIPGLGKKTAERILVELTETFQKIAPESVPAAVSRAGGSALLNDVASALGNLGFKAAQIDRALDHVRARDDLRQDFDTLFREAMQELR